MMRHIARAIAIAAAVLVICVSGVEAALRVYYGHPLVERYFRPSRNSTGYALAANQHYEYFHNGRLIRVDTDESGHRVVPGAPATADCTVFVIGDSQVFGWGLADAETIPARLQARVGPRCRFVNLGVPGYGPFAYADALRKLPEGATALVVQSEVNDLQNAALMHSVLSSRCGYLVSPTLLGQQLPCFVLSSYLLAKGIEFKVSLDRTLQTPIGYNPDAEAAARVLQFRIRNLYGEALEGRYDRALFTAIPWDAAIVPERLPNYAPLLQRATRLVDLPDQCPMYSAFQSYSHPQDSFQPNDSHLSPRGADLVADLLAPRVEQLVGHQRAAK